MSIPLVQKAEKDDINTSIIAIKRYIDRINQLLGLSDSGSSSDPDLSGLATKQELQDAVNSLQPVDEVTLNNMQSVTSNAVAKAMSYSTTEHFTGKYWIDGKKIYRNVVEYTSPVSIYNRWGDLLTIANVNQVISVSVLEYRSGENWTVPCMGRYINGTIQGQSNNGGANSTSAILEYTKTTD